MSPPHHLNRDRPPDDPTARSERVEDEKETFLRFEPKAFLANTALLAATMAILYVVGSIVLFMLPSLPPVLLRTLPLQLRVLGQNTKAERIPQDYIAILGDSYAEGVGDWLALRDPRGRYHSAHVIRDLTGRDVVSFGQSGAGSAQAIVRLPAAVVCNIKGYSPS